MRTPVAIAAVISAFLLGVLATSWLGKTPACQTAAPHQSPDAQLVRSLLGENLADRTFAFSTVAETCSGKRVLPLTDATEHRRTLAAIHQAMVDTLREMNSPDSPVRTSRRINEASRFFEDALHARLDAMPGFACGIPLTRAGTTQRSGYPDLRLVEQASGSVFYLDPKLIEKGSVASTLRTFYFEPKNETLKITEDAVHLLIGIEHDGKAGAWKFSGWRLVDLATLQVRLKTEFQASNAELHRKSTLSLTPQSD